MFNLFSGTVEKTVEDDDDDDDAILECDYDKNATELYQAIERKEWIEVHEFLETGRWSSSMPILLSLSNSGGNKKHSSPEKQVRTWTTRFEPSTSDTKNTNNNNIDGSNNSPPAEAAAVVRWSHLPLHAAIIFGAPYRVVNALIDLYPVSIQCTDDQNMLPLHLAFRFGANDTIMNLLLRNFPEGLFTNNNRGKCPYAIKGGPRGKDYRSILQQVIKSISSMQEQLQVETAVCFNRRIELQKQHAIQLKKENEEVEKQLLADRAELDQYKTMCFNLEGELKRKSKKMGTTRKGGDTYFGNKGTRIKNDPTDYGDAFNSIVVGHDDNNVTEEEEEREDETTTFYNRGSMTDEGLSFSFPLQSEMRRRNKDTKSQIIANNDNDNDDDYYYLSGRQHSQSHRCFNDDQNVDIYASPTGLLIDVQDDNAYRAMHSFYTVKKL